MKSWKIIKPRKFGHTNCYDHLSPCLYKHHWPLGLFTILSPRTDVITSNLAIPPDLTMLANFDLLLLVIPLLCFLWNFAVRIINQEAIHYKIPKELYWIVATTLRMTIWIAFSALYFFSNFALKYTVCTGLRIKQDSQLNSSALVTVWRVVIEKRVTGLPTK